MKLDEHKAILTELMSDTIDSKRKTDLLMQLGDDYGMTQATLTEKSTELEKTMADRDYYTDLSKRLWLENSATLTKAEKEDTTLNTNNNVEHEPKFTLDDLRKKF
jgi:superfamily II RNA helicase